MAFRIVLYVLLTMLQFYAANMLVRKRLKITGIADGVISTSIVVISQQILTGWILGLFKHLFILELSLFNFIVSVVLILASKPQRGDWLKPLVFIVDIFPTPETI